MEIEKETILLMSKGDKKAYETMFRRFYPKVHRFVAMLLKNEDDADDVSQLIFLKVWNKREKFADIQNFDSYLFILAKYTVINYISSKHIIPIDIDSLPDRYANESSPHDDVVAKDTQLLIDMVVESMPQQRQMIYRMSREQHLKNEEIAQRLGIQKKTVENHLNLALKEIKNGRKESHWMWYIFPQLKGLGRSYTSDFYGIVDLDEAKALCRLLKEFPHMHAWVSFSAKDGEHINSGERIAECAMWLDSQEQVIAIGVNCTAPQHIPSLIEQIKAVSSKPIIVYPNGQCEPI